MKTQATCVTLVVIITVLVSIVLVVVVITVLVSAAAVTRKYAQIHFSNCTFTFSPSNVLANGHTNTRLILRGD